MTTETNAQSQNEDAKISKSFISGEVVVGYATLGCLVAGTIGVLRGITTDGVGAGVCLLASVAAFGTVCYIYFRKG
jgi:hypothetical protein